MAPAVSRSAAVRPLLALALLGFAVVDWVAAKDAAAPEETARETAAPEDADAKVAAAGGGENREGAGDGVADAESASDDVEAGEDDAENEEDADEDEEDRKTAAVAGNASNATEKKIDFKEAASALREAASTPGLSEASKNMLEAAAAKADNEVLEDANFTEAIKEVAQIIGAATKKLGDALEGGKLDVIKQALEEGADKDVRNPENGQTPLLASVLFGHAHVVRFLLEKGADPKIPEQNGYTPMHAAAFQGRADIIPVLTSFGIEVNDRHKDGFEPIHRACWGTEKRHADTVAALLREGVDPTRKSADGQTPLELTKNSATEDVLEAAIGKAKKAKKEAAKQEKAKKKKEEEERAAAAAKVEL